MTKHERYLKQYPQRIALKRLKRRRKSHIHVDQKSIDQAKFRKVLSEYLKNNPREIEQIRAGKKKWHDVITKHFRKPTI